jgi:3-hydroxyacyl-CoA dehydrogenase/enoyl-CoA hydratase/3-hydroxybutyryl-CoA epimerase
VTINNPSEVATFECLKDRLFYIQIVETMKCYEEGILNTAHEGDVASIMGWGFPSHTGGVVSACHREGNQALLDKLSTLQEKWGERFSAPKILKTLINKNYDSLHEAREILSSPLLEE